MNADGIRHDGGVRSIGLLRRSASVATVFALVVAARAAAAQARDAAGSEWLFREGRALMKKGDLAAACSKLAESLRLDPAVGTLMNLAECEERQGRSASAWQRWATAADQLPTDDPRRGTALARARALEAVLPRLIVDVADSAPPGLTVTRDGVALGPASLGVPLPVDPGEHLIVASAAGHAARSFHVAIASGQHQTILVEPGAALPPPAQARPTAGPAPTPIALSTAPAIQRRRGRLVGYGLVAGGGVALAAGGYFALQALSARREASRSCVAQGGSNRCWSSARAALDRDRRASIAADVSFAAATLATASGLYLLLRTVPGATTAQVFPLADGGGVQLAGHF